jgi:hypothetical protein
MSMDMNISDDLQELRERIEVMAVSRDDAAIITRAALEIARLRGEAPITKEDRAMWTTFGTAAPQRVEFVEEKQRGTTMVVYRGSTASVPSDTLFAVESDAWLSMYSKADAEITQLYKRSASLYREFCEALKREQQEEDAR